MKSKLMNSRNFRGMAGMALCLALGVGFASCGSGKKKEEQSQQAMMAMAPELLTMVVEKTNAQNEKEYPAKLEGKTDIAIRPQVSGFITAVHVDEGQTVKKGQPLFTLDQVQFQAAVDQAQAAVNSAQTAVNTARMTADTKRQLFEKNIISAYDNQMAQNNLQTALAALSQAQAALTTARKNLSYTVVTAPSDGVVGSIPNREGSLASPSSMEPLTTISDNSKVYAYFSLTEKDLLDMTENGTRSLDEAIKAMPNVLLRLANGSIYGFPGEVATVSGVINSSTGSASVRALFDNPSGMLRSGSTGKVVIPVESENVIVIPQKATYEIQGKRFVYTVDKDNKLVSKPIEVLPQSDGQNFVVVSGLEPGEMIVVEGVGTMNVREGATITPTDEATRAQRMQAQAAAQAQQSAK